MPIVREFVYRESDRTGLNGLQPMWFENAEPFNGRVIAHDMLEHFRSQSSPIEGECEALGAALALRLQYIDPGLGEPLKFDVAQILLDALDEDLPTPSPRKSRAIEDEMIEGLICKGVRNGFKSAKEDLAWLDYPKEKVRALLEPSMQEAFIGFIRHGFRKALKRFRACDLYTVGHDVFELIEKKVDQLLSSEQLAPEDRVKLSVDCRRGLLDVRVNGRCAYEYGYL